MRILGLDPGYAIVGWAVLDIEGQSQFDLVSYGTITTRQGLPMPTRLNEVFHDLQEIIDEFSPDYAGVEKVMLHKNVKTATKVGEDTGVILLALEQASVPIYEVTPLQVKNAVVGHGRAKKDEVQRAVTLLCGLSEIPQPDDAADAIAVAICAHSHILSGARPQLY